MPMRQRALRVRTASFPATLSMRPYDVLNISITGALGLLEGARPVVGSVHSLHIGVGTDVLAVNARVVRTNPTGWHWETAIDFEYRQPATPQRIGAVITHLIRDF